MITNQIEPVAVLRFLDSKSCKVDNKLLRKHLSAFSIDYQEKESVNKKGELEPISNNISDIDFSQKIDLDNPKKSLELLQKITLKMFLNQSRITLKAQQKMIDGIVPDMPRDTLENMSLCLDMLEKTSALSMTANQQQILKMRELKDKPWLMADCWVCRLNPRNTIEKIKPTEPTEPTGANPVTLTHQEICISWLNPYNPCKHID